jgi:hypothetical protein
MRNKYKLPAHIRHYIKNELYDFKKNKEKLEEIQLTDTSTRTILIATQRIQNIEAVFNDLTKDEMEIARKIFFEKCNQVYMETNHYITRDAYYNTMNKVIYQVAKKLDMI